MSVSPPGGGGEAPEAADAPQRVVAAERPECPRCGTTHEPNQEYCLECGLRLPVEASGLVPRLSRAWRSRLGWYPGDWVWPSLLALLIAALAGIGAAAFVSHDEKRAGYVTATSPFEPVTSAITAAEHTPTVPSGSTQTGTQPSPPQQTPALNQALKVWPADRQSGWTVVLQSLPATTNGRAFAVAQARAAEHSGLQDVGIIDSSKYSSLHPGYYVLFSGVYTSFDDANTGVTDARSHGYPRAYAKRITR